MEALNTLLLAPATPVAASPAPAEASGLTGMLFSLLLQAPAPAADPVSAADEVPDAQDAANLLPWINLLPRLLAANDAGATPSLATTAAPAATTAPATQPVTALASGIGMTATEAALPQLKTLTENGESTSPSFGQPEAPVTSVEGLGPLPGAQPPAPVAAAAPVHQVVTAAPSSPEWADEFSHQVVWTAREGLRSAEIKLHPQEYGSIAVHLEMDDSQARLSFSTTHVTASSAIEQSLPRLRELFAHEGLNLGQVQVFTQTSQDQARQRQSQPQSPSSARNGQQAEPSVSAVRTVRRSGLLDDYA